MCWEEGGIIFCIIIIVGGSISIRCFLLGLWWIEWWIGGRCCRRLVVIRVFVVIHVCCCCSGGGIWWVVLRERKERRGIGGIECVSKGIIHLADASLPFSPIGTGASVVVVAAMREA